MAAKDHQTSPLEACSVYLLSRLPGTPLFFPFPSLTHSLANTLSHLYSQPKVTTSRKPFLSLILSQMRSSMIPQTLVGSFNMDSAWTC